MASAGNNEFKQLFRYPSFLKFIQIDRRYTEIVEELSGLESSIEKIRSFGRYAIRYMNEMGIRTMRVVYLSQFGDGKKPSFVVSKKRPVYKIIDKMVREGQQKGELRDDMDSRDITEIIVRSTRGIVLFMTGVCTTESITWRKKARSCLT